MGRLLLAFAVLVLVCGCICDGVTPEHKSGTDVTVQSIPSTTVGKNSGSGLKTVCEKLPAGENRALCLGLVNNDSSECGKLESQENRDQCYARMGDYILDAAICEKIVADTPHDRCVETVAFETGNPDVCVKCRNRFDNILCRALAGKEMKLCEQLQKPDFRALCTAYAGENLASCDTVQDKSLKDDCQIRFAIKRQDKSLCEKIEDANTKALCLTIVQKNKAVCEKIPQGEYRIRCNAVVEDDPSVCDQIKDPESRSNCMRTYVEILLKYYD